MEELEQLILKKIDIYKSLYICADEMDRQHDCKYYGKQLKKLNKILKILWFDLWCLHNDLSTRLV